VHVQPVVAVDGRAALERAKEILPDILITEILLPKLDGLALCRQIKSDPRTAGVTVLVFSILAATSRAEEAGADAFLMKPLEEERLLVLSRPSSKRFKIWMCGGSWSMPWATFSWRRAIGSA